MPYPASAYACTFFFSDSANSVGWSETYYIGAATLGAAYADAALLLDVRKDILVSTYGCDGFRVSDTSILGDSKVSTAVVVGTISATLHPPCEPWTALMYRFEAGAAHRGRKFCHGVPRDMFLGNRMVDPAGPNIAGVTAFAAWLIANTWGLKATLAVGPPRTYQYLALTTVGAQRQVEHRVGRPFGLLRGRR